MSDVVRAQEEVSFFALAANLVESHTLDENVMPTADCVDAPSGNLTITEVAFIAAIAWRNTEITH